MRLFSLARPALTGTLMLAVSFIAGCGSNNTSSSSSGTTSTATALVASSTSTTTGTSITLTATVSPSAATGTVTFYNGSSSLGTATLSSGTATLKTSFSSAGTYSIKAVYGGSSTYATSTSSTVSISVTTSGSTATSTSLTSSSSTTTVGASITLTATVSPTAVTGTVTFYSGSTSIGTGTLSSGIATLTTSFSTAGTYTLTATYAGNSTYATSTSSSITETVDEASTSGTTSTTSLSASPTTAYPGSLVVLTATVSPTAATGTVSFYQGSTSLGSATLSSGTATLTTHFSSTGTYSLTALYSGDSTYSSSTSSAVSETVASGTYSLDLSSYSCTSGSMTITTDSSHTVDYCLYSNVVYAANPVDSSYESMNIYIPTSVDGTSVSDKPVMIENGVGGYLSSKAGNSPGTNGEYSLGKGYVVVEVGCRGRDNSSTSLGYYGKAPAAIVDLKAAVRFLRYNSGLGSFTGDVDRIISSGGSAGGALSTLLGASGNSSLYDTYLAAIGAADADDNIFAVGAWSPITNLDHADMAYEWEYGSLKYSGSTVDSTVSGDLQTNFESYQDGLALTGKRDSFGSLTYSNIDNYILTEYLEPSAATYLESLSSSTLSSYLSSNSWITWDSTNKKATFTFANYLADHIGTRGKSVPAFDSFFDLSSTSLVVNTTTSGEVQEFGSSSTNARHFTDFSDEYVDSTDISSSQQTVVNMMNPMYFILNAISGGDSSGIAKYWYIRDGAVATDTSAIVIVDLSSSVEDLLGTGYVNAAEDWTEGHNVNADPGGFSTWVTNSVAAD